MFRNERKLRMFHLARGSVLASCLGAVLLACEAQDFVVAPSASSDTSRLLRVPDFSGLWTRTWIENGTFDPPPEGPGPIMVDPAYPRSSFAGAAPWIPDLSNPILQPETREALRRIAERELQFNPHIELQTMCMPPGVPEILNLRDNMQILQTPDEVILFYARDHHARHVYMNQAHPDDPGHTWWGHSVGHYDGDTLVVDTIGLNDQTHSDRFGTPHSDQIHVVERYRLSDDGTILEVLFAVEDPVAFTMPWSARADYQRDANPILETVCAENNRPNGTYVIPIPIDTTPDF